MINPLIAPVPLVGIGAIIFGLRTGLGYSVKRLWTGGLAVEQTGQGEGALEITPLKRAELRPEDLEPIADFDLNLPDPTDRKSTRLNSSH